MNWPTTQPTAGFPHGGRVSPGTYTDEVVAALVWPAPKTLAVWQLGGTVHLVFSEEPTAAQKTTLAARPALHDPLPTLRDARQGDAEDDRTEYMEARGYPEAVQTEMAGLHAQAVFDGLVNRAAYLAAFFDWDDAVHATEDAAVADLAAATTPALIAAVAWTYTTHTAADPGVTPAGARAIPD